MYWRIVNTFEAQNGGKGVRMSNAPDRPRPRLGAQRGDVPSAQSCSPHARRDHPLAGGELRGEDLLSVQSKREGPRARGISPSSRGMIASSL